MVDVVIKDNRWQSKITDPILFFESIINNITELQFCISLLLADDNTLCELNNKFRNINKPTNVLSFPQYDDMHELKEHIVRNMQFLQHDIKNDVKEIENVIFLGDIAISYDKISIEAKIYNKTFEERLAHIFVHGVLHMLGFDHDTEKDRKEMEDTEVMILRKLGISDPYVI